MDTSPDKFTAKNDYNLKKQMHFNMMKYKFTIFILLFALLVPGFLQAQRPLLFEKITDPNGRSLGFITGIEQDEHGFLWFSTRNGLYRYDGYDYKLFKHKKNDTTSIPFNDITNLYLDKSGILWLTHFDHFASFHNEKQIHCYPEITDRTYDLMEVKIIEDPKGNYWIGPCKEGLIKYNKKTHQSELFKKSPPLYSPDAYNVIDSMFQNVQPVASLTEIGNNCDTLVTVSVKKTTEFLIISAGEIDEHGIYDYGMLTTSEDTLWQMDLHKTKYAGGAEKNKVQIASLRLQPGEYQLRFISDASNSQEGWKEGKPDKIPFYGIQIYTLTSDLQQIYNQRISQQYTPKNSISSNEIKDMLIDNSGNFCFVSPNGIDTYNYETGLFTNYHINFAKLLHVHSAQSLTITQLYQDRQNNYWIGTDAGLIHINTKTKKETVYQNTQDNPNVLTGNYILSIFQDHSHTLWVGTSAGLNIFDSYKKIFFSYTADNKNRLYDNKIFNIYEDRSLNLWIATSKGLNKLIKSDFKYFDLGIEEYTAYPVCIDRNNFFWYRGQANALYSFDKQHNEYNVYPLQKDYFRYNEYSEDYLYLFNDIIEDTKKNLWIAIDKGLYRFDRKAEKVTDSVKLRDFNLNDTLMLNEVYSVFEDSQNKLWVIGLNKAYQYSAQNKTFIDSISLNIVNADNYEEGSRYIKYITEDTRHNLWIRSSVGLHVVDLDKKQTKQVISFDESIKMTSLTDGNLFVDKNGNVWFPMLPKLYKFKDYTTEPELFIAKDCGDVANCQIVKTFDENLWIHSYNGLFAFNKESRTFQKYTTRDGIVDNNINGVFDDYRGNLWLTTPKGLSKFNIKEENSINYFHAEDFSSYYFLGISEVNRKEIGEVILFTSKGFLSYYPDSINHHPPPLVITRFTMFGKDYDLDSLIHLKKSIELNYDQNFIAFEFSALDFTDPDKNKYTYMLEGLDKEWTFCDANNRKASYTSIPPGKYVFRLKGSNNDKVWNQDGLSIHITIKPPFWQTWWFRTLMALLALAIVYLVIKFRERKLQREKNILEQKVRERTAEIAKQNKEIAAQRDKVMQQRDQIAKQKEEITDSIHYASRIQKAILPAEKTLQNNLNDYFILYKPKDIVSGDFYWMTKNDGQLIVTAADCTGHGVPGAFMSMLGVTFLNDIVIKQKITNANDILNQLRDAIIASLHQKGEDGETKDGMDIALCIIDIETKHVQYAGAYNPLYIIRNPENNESKKTELTQIKADKMPIGIYFGNEKPFNKNELQLYSGDAIYMFSDGYADQFGGELGKKFMSKKFKRLLTSIYHKPMSEQKEILNNTIESWKGTEYEQIDDILVMGVKV